MIPALAGIVSPRGIKPETNYDIIWKAYVEHRIHELPIELQEQAKRWKRCNALLIDGQTLKKGKDEIIRPYRYNQLVEFLVEEFGISHNTARNDIKHTKRFFAVEETRDEKNFGKGIYLEWLERWMFECAGKGDHKSAAAYAKLIKEVRGYDRVDEDAPKYDEIQIPHLEIVVDPSELGFEKIENPDQVVANILKKRKKSALDRIIDNAELATIIEDIKIDDRG